MPKMRCEVVRIVIGVKNREMPTLLELLDLRNGICEPSESGTTDVDPQMHDDWFSEHRSWIEMAISDTSMLQVAERVPC